MKIKISTYLFVIALICGPVCCAAGPFFIRDKGTMSPWDADYLLLLEDENAAAGTFYSAPLSAFDARFQPLSALLTDISSMSSLTIGDMMQWDGNNWIQISSIDNIDITLGTINRVIITDSNGNLAVSDITSTELLNLDGSTDNIQDQIDEILDGTTPFTGDIQTSSGAVIGRNGSGSDITGNISLNTSALLNKMYKVTATAVITLDAAADVGFNACSSFVSMDNLSDSINASISLSSGSGNVTIDLSPTGDAVISLSDE